jgi:hypothetical protein
MPFDSIVVSVFVVSVFLVFMATLAYARQQTAKIPPQDQR